MKYFIDTEFLEGPQKEKFPISLFRKQTPNTIDLISIGIVAEDEREYYAISKDFNLEEAWNRWQYNEKYVSGKNQQGKEYWLRENVLKPIFKELIEKYDSEYKEDLKKGVCIGTIVNYDFSFKLLKFLINRYGKTNKEIAEEIVKFCEYRTQHEISLGRILHSNHSKKPEFYAYYADYDWVVFCWLFGKMIDLPKGFPMYCKDLKQDLDILLTGDMIREGQTLHSNELVELRGLSDKNERLEWLKNYSKCFPKQDASKSHNAIEDARWNKKIYEFLKTL